MTRKLNWFVILTAMLALFAMGCGDDDDNGTGPSGGGNVPIDLSQATIQVPQGVNDAAGAGNIGAQQTVSYVAVLNSFSVWSAFYTPPPAKIAQSDSYSWTYEGITVTMQWTESETAVSWSVTVDGSDGESTYDNFVLLEGYQAKGDVEGDMSVYDPSNPGPAFLQWSWNTDPSDVFSVLMSNILDDIDISGSVNPDGSGTLSYSDGGTTRFTSSWTAAGTGTWATFDFNGDPQDSGSWGPSL